MNYKYITGEVLEINPNSGWTDGTLLQDIYPDSFENHSLWYEPYVLLLIMSVCP